MKANGALHEIPLSQAEFDRLVSAYHLACEAKNAVQLKILAMTDNKDEMFSTLSLAKKSAYASLQEYNKAVVEYNAAEQDFQARYNKLVQQGYDLDKLSQDAYLQLRDHLPFGIWVKGGNYAIMRDVGGQTHTATWADVLAKQKTQA